MAYYTGKGATFSAPGVSGACARSISISGFSRDKIETTCLDDTGDFKTYVPSAFTDAGEVTATIAAEGAMPIGSVGDIGTITVNFGNSAEATPAAGPSLTGSGFITDISSSELNGTSLVEYTITCCFDGLTEPTFS